MIANKIYYLIELYRLVTVPGESTEYQIDLAGTSTSCPPGTTICKVDKSQATKTSLGLTTGHQFYVEGQWCIVWN